MMTRKDILRALEEEQQRVIENLQEQVERYKNASDIDEDDTLDPEDLSHQSEAKDLQLRFEQMLAQTKAFQGVVSNEEQAHDTAQDGSVLVTDEMIMYLGVSVPKFEYKGKEIIGISKEAPVYKEAMGKKKGDALKMGATSVTISEIL